MNYVYCQLRQCGRNTSSNKSKILKRSRIKKNKRQKTVIKHEAITVSHFEFVRQWSLTTQNNPAFRILFRTTSSIWSPKSSEKSPNQGWFPGSIMKHFGEALKPRITLDWDLIFSPSVATPSSHLMERLTDEKLIAEFGKKLQHAITSGYSRNCVP